MSSRSPEPMGVRGAVQPRGPHVGAKIEKAKDPRGTLRRVSAYFADFKAGLALVIGCVVLYAGLGLLGPYLMGAGLDRFVARGDASGLSRIALLMLAAYLANNLFQALANWLMAGISQRALRNIRRDLFRHLQTLPLAFFDRNPAGELMS